MNNSNPLSSFRFQVILRVVLLVALCILLAGVFFYTNWFFTPLVVSILIVITTINLIRYHEHTNREITTFLTSLKQANFTNRYTTSNKGKSFDKLEKLFEDINLAFQKVSADKESHYQYLQALNDNIGVAIISYLDDGKVQLMNPSAKKLFNKPSFSNISELERVTPEVFRRVMELKQGGNDVVKTVLNNEVQYLSVTCRTFVAQEVPFHLVLIQNIRKALDDRESEAWQKLVRVLTHEIMNSVTPISSLSTAVNQTLKDSKQMAEISEEDMQDIHLSLETIENRSNGLVRFVKAYKDYAKDIDLTITEFSVQGLISRVNSLLSGGLDEQAITLKIDIRPSTLSVQADEELLEQVLINLIKNAIDVLTEKNSGAINIRGYKEGTSTIIEVQDNGPGIAEENIENIFVPFFTTKRKGTGVGLSLSKKIMQLHGGDIQVSTSESGSVFRLVFGEG